MSEENKQESNLVQVGAVCLVKGEEDGQFTGVELLFTDQVLNRQGAAMVMDNIRGALNSSIWVASTLLRAPAEENNAQTDEEADTPSDTDDEVSGKKRTKVAKQAN